MHHGDRTGARFGAGICGSVQPAEASRPPRFAGSVRRRRSLRVAQRDAVPSGDAEDKSHLEHKPLRCSKARQQLRCGSDLQGGVVHPSLQDADFVPIAKGDPVYTLLDGTEVSYDGKRRTLHEPP